LSETPQIAPISGESRQSTENLTPSAFAAPLINISNPSALPAPTGTTDLLNLLGNAGTFRDMSGLSNIVDLAKIGSAGGNEVAKMAMMAANPSYLGALFNETEKKTEKKKADDKKPGTDDPDDDGGGNGGGGGGNGGEESDDPGTKLLATAGGTNSSGDAVATVAGENGGYDNVSGENESPNLEMETFSQLGTVFFSIDGEFLGKVGNVDDISPNTNFKYDTLVVVVHGDHTSFAISEFEPGGTYGDLSIDIAINEYNNATPGTSSIELLEISCNEILNRANWFYGETGGVNQEISQVRIMGVDTTITPTPEFSFYAHAIHNLRNRPVYRNKTPTFFFSNAMESYPYYFNGSGGTTSAKSFANARDKGFDELIILNNAIEAIAAVLRTLSRVINEEDVVDGRYQWKGRSKATDIMDSTNERWKVLYFPTGQNGHHAFHYL
jgi:hypothetical protein